MNISKTVRDRAISSEFLTHRVVQDCPMQRGGKSIFATFVGHLAFLRKMNISKTIQDRVISSEFLTHRVVQECPMQKGKIINFGHFWRLS